MKRKKNIGNRIIILLAAVCCQVSAQQVSVAPYYGGRQAALSLTFDDGLEDQYTLAFPQLKARGLKATFAVIGSKVGGVMRSKQDRHDGIDGTPCMTWAMLREMSSEGMEITNHGWQHQNVTRLSGEALRYEVQHNDSVIFQQTGQFPRTFFYPGNNKSEETIAFCEQGRVGSRTYQVSIGSKRNSAWLRQWVDGLIEQGQWGVGMTHGIARGYDHFGDPQVLWTFYDYLVEKQDELWVAPFSEVSAYVKERDNVHLTVEKTPVGICITPIITLDRQLFSQPLTLVIDSQDVLSVTQGGQSPIPVFHHQGKTLFDIDPFGDCVQVVLSAQAQTERPTMGWSSWNTYRVNISDSLIMRQADAMVMKGLRKAGYQYVNIDDGYFGGRDKTSGRLLIHPRRFPNGLKPVVDHIHRLGLKAGIYSDAGRNTCGSIYDADTIGVGVGLYGHDQQDCDLFFRELGFDFIKVDYCGGRPHPKGDTLSLDEHTRYTEIAEAIRKTGRKDVRLNVCRWDYPGTWVSDVASSWRMSQDIRPKWESVKNIIQQNLYLSAYAGGGHYNDMDMLEVGRGMSQEEDHTHFAVWCMMSSPLLIGCDLMKIKPETLNLLTDPQLIAINQDPLGLQAYVAKRQGDCYVLVKDVKKLNDTERAVAFVNLSDEEQTINLDLRDIDLVGDALSAAMPPHATRIFVVKGKQRLQRRIYEAETAFLTSYQELKNNQAYLTAIYEEDVRCSGGVKASWLGGRADNDMRWRDVYVDKAGRYCLRLNCLTDESRTMYIDVNGRTVDSLSFHVNGEQTVFADLLAGCNEVRLWNAEGRMPDVDYMIVDDHPVAFGRLTVEGRVEPLGLDDLHPRFGWQLVSGENDVRQTGYRIIVSSFPNDQIIWDSGEMQSDSSQWVAYKGSALQPNKDYYWQVRVTTNKGISDWSRVQKWSMGLLDAGNWKGDWIGLDSLTDDVKLERHSRIAARHLRKDFQISKPLKRATAHVCGLGYYILNINGQRIGDYLLAPAPTQYDKAAIYDTYDVTSYILPHTSYIEATLAGGYFFPPTQNYQTNVRSAYGMPKLLLNLIIEYEDGTTETIATDSTWQVAVDGPIRYANLYDGTLIDYHMKPTQWMPAQVVEAPCQTLRGNTLGGVKVYATEQIKGIVKVDEEKFILDFGTNNTGRVYLPKVTIPEGDTIRIRYAETLQIDGKSVSTPLPMGEGSGVRLYTANLRQAQNTDLFVGNGSSVTITTEFLWHGFRYLEVTGLSEKDARRITRQLMTDDLLSTASIDMNEDDGMINKILANARRGILSNYKGIPMDCPQRDERMPWLGDRTMGCFGESYLTNNHTLYAKWLQDICDAQRKDGSISDVSPAYWRLYNGNITWPAALPFGLEMLRLQYGDERPMREHAENVKRFLQFAKQKSGKDGLITYDRYGDWCVPPASLDEVLTKDSTRMTDGALISSCYYYYICKMLAHPQPLPKGGENDAAYFAAEAERTKAAINRTFLHDGCYANGTVTANLLPLAMDIIPDSVREVVKETFIRKVTTPLSSRREARGEAFHIDCGVIGISWLMRYLSRAGLGDIAYQIASTKTYPGWGYMVENGATTIWELWNGNTANPSMNSGNHVMMLGDLIPWAFECLAGIAPDPARPGFKHVIMRPDFSIEALNGVTATYPSIYGDIKSTWSRQDGKVICTVTIPANTTATLYLPDGKKKEIGSGTYQYVTTLSMNGIKK
ncbi:MAG: family 78 glycoside hydrolase catalytic domain [Prevotella sp.]|nr:family 78 glycoside hydrolase catalytic domain [Prevotella sp.]